MGEDDLGGILKSGFPVKLGKGIPDEFIPEFLGGTTHTAHPNRCPDTGNLVGWHWSHLPTEASLEVTVTEWAEGDLSPVAPETFVLKNRELAPHDMALTENCAMLKVNSLKTNHQLQFMPGNKGPAASLEMDGRAGERLFARAPAAHGQNHGQNQNQIQIRALCRGGSGVLFHLHPFFPRLRRSGDRTHPVYVLGLASLGPKGFPGSLGRLCSIL